MFGLPCRLHVAFALLSLSLAGGCARGPVVLPPTRSPVDHLASAPPSRSNLDPARVAKLADFVSATRGHPFTRALPPVRFVPESELPALAGPERSAFEYSARYLRDRHEIIVKETLEQSPELEPVVVHELVHALISAHAPPGEQLPPEVAFARAALVEGDAELVEWGYRAAASGLLPRRAMAGVARVHADFIPLPCRDHGDVAQCATASALYEEGRAFASALYRAGGTALLDAAYGSPPKTTLEVLFPDLYLAGIRPRSLAEELGVAVSAAGLSREHLGALNFARTIGTPLSGERMRTMLHELRGDGYVKLDGEAGLFLTEWTDDLAAARMADALGEFGNVLVVRAGPRRLLFGVGPSKPRLLEIAKAIVPTTPLPAVAPPFGRRFTLTSSPWEEEAARELRGGQRGFAVLGIDAGTLRAERAGSSHAWLTPDDDKLFVFPAARAGLDDKLAAQLVEQAWKEGATGATALASQMTNTAFGPVPLLLARLNMASPLHFALARIPLCGDRGAALFVLQFGAGPEVQAALERQLGRFGPTPEPKKAPLCRRLADEAKEDFVPPAAP